MTMAHAGAASEKSALTWPWWGGGEGARLVTVSGHAMFPHGFEMLGIPKNDDVLSLPLDVLRNPTINHS